MCLSSGGKSVLIESSLRYLPNYTMGVYLLTNEVHHKIYLNRANFYWDSENKKKYHMVKWEELTKAKDHGGLGFTYTRMMNKCLLAKWIIKLERGDGDLCSTLLRKKYLKGRDFFNTNPRGALNFERDCMKSNPHVRSV
jgi:hypothetical protein